MISVLLTHHTLELEALNSCFVVARLWKGWVRTAEKAVRGYSGRREIRSFGDISGRRLQEIYSFQIVLGVVRSCLFELGPCRISDSLLLRHTDRRP